jgi:hypothetical protein
MLPAIGLGIGLIGGVGKMIARSKANKDLKKLMGQDPVYSENPLARQRLGLAQTLLNARMPGSAAAERNIYQNQANYMGQVGRNATDASQVLALAGAAQGQSNQAFGELAQAEAQDYQRRYANMADAQEGVIREGDKVFQDRESNFQNKVAMQGKINENRQNSWGEVSNLGFGLASVGLSGGMDGLFKSGGAAGSANPVPVSGQEQYRLTNWLYNKPKFNPATGRIG